ncbi:cytoskeleton-associated protein 2-like, partial [Clarias magur]
PYLKSSAVLTKAPGGAQKSHTSVKGKENSAPSATTAKKDLSKGNAPVEKNKNLRILPKAPSTVLPRLPLKSTVAQTASQQTRTRYHVIRNASVKEQQTKSDIHRSVVTQRQDKIVKKGSVSVSSHAHPPHWPLMNARTNTIKTDLQKRRLVTGSEKVVQQSQVNCPTMKERLTTTVPRCIDTKSSVSKGATVTLQNTRETNNLSKNNFDVKKPLNRYPVGKPDRSEKTQTNSQNTRLLNKVENKPALTRTQRSSIPVTDRQRSGVLSTTSKTENASKSTAVTVGGVKNAAPHRQQRRTTFIVPSKPNVPAPVPQTLPGPAKTSSLTRGPAQLKTPKSTFSPGTDGVRTVPLADRTKLTTAQEERLRKLQAWRESKGITYKRPPMPVQPARRKTTALPPQGYWSTIEKEDEVHGFVCAVDQSLNDCIKLLQQGCPAGQVRDILSRVPMAQKFAKYWICQVRLMEQEGNLDVLPTFEEAVRVVREPVDELRSVVFEILKKKDVKASLSERPNDLGGDEDEEQVLNTCTPKAVGALIRGEKGDSSVIKYKITATPG